MLARLVIFLYTGIMPSLVILHHSVYGHTAKVAEAVAAGAGGEMLDITALDDAAWARLDAADGIIFGSPTYMGGVTAPFKAFIDATSKRWSRQAWRDKIAAGFVNAGSHGGDNLNALYQLMVFAMQHSMVWVGSGIMPVREGEAYINRTGGFVGLFTQAGNASPEVTPPPEDLETARRFGARVAVATARWKKGEAL